MLKRAQKLIETHYGETALSANTHPALFALVNYAAQNPGLEPGNYGTGMDGWRALQEESRNIGNDWKRFKTALAECASEGVTDAQVIEAAKGAFSGRLQWSGDHWEYTTGQYWPTEYRKAAASVLESAIHAVKVARPAVKRTVVTIAALRELNEQNGGCWFKPSSMRFFGTKIESGIFNGRFVTSEQPPHGPRKYTLRKFNDEGDISTEGEFCGYNHKAQAMKALRELPALVTT